MKNLRLRLCDLIEISNGLSQNLNTDLNIDLPVYIIFITLFIYWLALNIYLLTQLLLL